MKSNQGVYEWASQSINIQVGCEHGCRYCYAREIIVRHGRCTNETFLTPEINQKKVDKGYSKRKGCLMFPSSHDVTPLNINEFCCVLRKLLDAGNNVLIVSKPHWSCITLICEGFKEYRDQILFRFTIGSTSDDVLGFWEPNAPSFRERLACLQYAYHAGYKTSVSCEPYLDPYVVYTYTACKPYITDSFWIGKMRHLNSRVRLDDATPEQIDKYVNMVKAASTQDVVKSIIMLLNDKPYIRWKDSIREVMEID